MHIPKAHMAAQGKIPSNKGAAPIATNQLQFMIIPALTIATANTIRPRLPVT
jgi:hypothetical protein